MLAYVHARREPPDDQGGGGGSSPAGGDNAPIGIVLAVWLWAIMGVMVLGLFVSWL